MRRLLLALTTLGLISLGSTSLLAQNWSAWKPDTVFPGIEVRERCSGFNDFANSYLWDIQLRNRYQKNVDLFWSAEPERLRGAQAQTNRALSVKPGEVVDARHTAPSDCSAGLFVKVDEVKGGSSSGTASASTASGTGPERLSPKPGTINRLGATGSVVPLESLTNSGRGLPPFAAHWTSKDPEPLRKDLEVQVSGKTVTTTWSSPSFSFQVTTPLPEHIGGSISVGDVTQKSTAH